jgi:dipeptidyl aminopeptidase/acylaminoacyl peptidase
MPWDGTQLFVATVSPDGKVTDPVLIAGKRLDISVVEPVWLSDTQLAYISDETGFWTPYLYDVPKSSSRPLVPASHELARSDFTEPLWMLGLSSFVPLDNDLIVFTRVHQGFHWLWLYSISKQTWTPLETDYVDICAVRKLGSQSFSFCGTKMGSGVAVVTAKLTDNTRLSVAEVVPPGSQLQPEDLAKPQGLTLKTGQGQELYVVFHAPINKRYTGPPGALPPCIVLTHGGYVPPGHHGTTS